jgi:Cu2+-exporting ATPase
VNGERYRIGAAGYVSGLCCGDAPAAEDDTGQTMVYLGSAAGMLARFDIGDELRVDARTAIEALQAMGLKTVIASGDREAAVARTAATLAIDDWHAGLSPADKLALIRDFRDRGETVVMVGDGINDAPVLAAADASVALDAGTALARASADAVSLGRQLGTIVDAMEVACKTRRIIRQNIGWAIVYNVTAVPLAVSGMLSPWMAALGMSLSSLIVVLNALRLHHVDIGRSDAARPLHAGSVEREAIS